MLGEGGRVFRHPAETRWTLPGHGPWAMLFGLRTLSQGHGQSQGADCWGLSEPCGASSWGASPDVLPPLTNLETQPQNPVPHSELR